MGVGARGARHFEKIGRNSHMRQFRDSTTPQLPKLRPCLAHFC
jgi:hypothetical protein